MVIIAKLVLNNLHNDICRYSEQSVVSKKEHGVLAKAFPLGRDNDIIDLL